MKRLLLIGFAACAFALAPSLPVSTGDPWTNSEGQVRCEARTDRELRRSSAPGDLRGQRRLDEAHRTVDLGHSSDGPSWIDLAENRFNTTESRFAACLNRPLQQNRHFSDLTATLTMSVLEDKADFPVARPNFRV